MRTQQLNTVQSVTKIKLVLIISATYNQMHTCKNFSSFLPLQIQHLKKQVIPHPLIPFSVKSEA